MLVHYRQRGSSIPDALVAAGVDVQMTDLPVGDYVLGPGLAVERKGPNVLGASIRDGRIFDQAVRPQSAFAQAVLLVEGEPRGITEPNPVCGLEPFKDSMTLISTYRPTGADR